MAVCLPWRNSRAPLHANRTYPISWYSLQSFAQYESDKLNSWPRGVLAKFDVFHQCKIRCSAIHSNTLPDSNSHMSSVLSRHQCNWIFVWWADMSGVLTGIRLHIPILSSYMVRAETCREEPRLTIFFQLNSSRVPVLLYNSSKPTPITLWNAVLEP